METKSCIKCEEIKNIENFYLHKNCGRVNVCKKCHSEDSKRRRSSSDFREKRLQSIKKNSSIDKKCRKCNSIKKLTKFYKNLETRDGRCNICIECFRQQTTTEEYKEKNRRRYSESKERKKRERKQIKEFFCKNCNEIKPTKDFYFSAAEKYGIYPLCKICSAEKSLEYRKTEKYKKKWIVYYEANKEKIAVHRRLRRARKRGLEEKPLKKEDLDIVKKIFGWKCFNCEAKKNLCLDHHIPLSKKGILEIGNIVPLCGSCNASKHCRWPEDFYTPQKLREVQNKLGETLTESGIHFYPYVYGLPN